MSTNEKTTVSSGTGVDESLLTDSIIETAERIAEISQFVTAIRNAGFAGDLGSPDLRTLFAPVNQSIGAMSEERLKEIVARHIAIGRQTEADLRTTSEVRTLAGPVPVHYESQGATFGGAKIIRHDIVCVNGQIHLLDGVAHA